MAIIINLKVLCSKAVYPHRLKNTLFPKKIRVFEPAGIGFCYFSIINLLFPFFYNKKDGKVFNHALSVFLLFDF